MPDRTRAGRLADVALEAASGDETEVVVSQVEQELNRFTADHPVQNLVRRTASIAVRVRVDGREGKAATGTPTEEAVRAAVARAETAARHLPPLGDVPPMPGPQEYRLRNAAPLVAEPEQTADAVGRLTAAARERGCTAAGTLGGITDLRLVRNSRGLDVCDVDTRSRVSFSVFHGNGAGWAGHVGAVPDLLDVGGVAETAVAKARAGDDPTSIDKGDYTVVLEPSAVASLLLFAAYKGFGAQQVEEGSSFLAGRLGEAVAAPSVSIRDDVHHPLSLGHVFDGEGVPRAAVPLIESGRAVGVVHDRATAGRQGCRTTGHAQPQPSVSGPMPSNLVLSTGGAGAEALLRGVRRGVLVTEFHYTNMVEPTKLTLTGMTRNGTFLIEDGRVTRAVRNMRFTQSLVEALGRVSAIGDDARLCSALFGGFTVVPSVRIEGFRFSSTTEF